MSAKNNIDSTKLESMTLHVDESIRDKDTNGEVMSTYERSSNEMCAYVRHVQKFETGETVERKIYTSLSYIPSQQMVVDNSSIVSIAGAPSEY